MIKRYLHLSAYYNSSLDLSLKFILLHFASHCESVFISDTIHFQLIFMTSQIILTLIEYLLNSFWNMRLIELLWHSNSNSTDALSMRALRMNGRIAIIWNTLHIFTFISLHVFYPARYTHISQFECAHSRRSESESAPFPFPFPFGYFCTYFAQTSQGLLQKFRNISIAEISRIVFHNTELHCFSLWRRAHSSEITFKMFSFDMTNILISPTEHKFDKTNSSKKENRIEWKRNRNAYTN